MAVHSLCASPDLVGAARYGDAVDVLDGLDPEQRQVVLAPVGPVCVLAGAGTGKTRAITRRVAQLVRTGAAPAEQVLAVTFTARAAGEMRTRLRLLAVEGVQARTFHAAALRQLSYFWPQTMGGQLPQLMASKAALVATAARSLRLSLSGTVLRDVTGEIEWAKASLLTPDAYAAAATEAGRQPPVPAEQVARVAAAYEQVKGRQQVLDFEDLLLLTAAVIEGHRFVADEVRARYRHFTVDEYQDVNPLQQRLLDAWVGGRASLTVVGDPDQTIYSFTGASASYLHAFGRRYPDAVRVRLIRDYRSTPQVVSLANRVIGAGKLVAQQPPGPEPDIAGVESEADEAALVARRIRSLLDEGVPASQVAVLFRINAQSQTYESALAAAGIPYLLRGGERFFDRPEVREAVTLLRGAARAADPGAGELLDEVRSVLATTGWRAGEPPAGAGAARDRWENVNALVGLAESLAEQQPEAALPTLVTELTERAAQQHAPTVEGVTLASLHAAKGLEWEAVFLVGLTEGLLPISHATTDEQVAEERRLLYVGITRARRHLCLSYARSREAGRRPRRPSRFIEPLLPQQPVVGQRAGRGRSARGAEGAGLDGDDAQVFERLRAWRAERAREQKQPAFVVFTDATLAAVARARPGSDAELRTLSGIGVTKLDRYGSDVLAVINGTWEPAGTTS